MMKDPYEILGVSRTATEKEIKAAHRKLAKQLHPDLNPGKPEVAERFKQVSAAYDLLSDKEKRRRYDAGEIDAEGNEKPQYRYYNNMGAGMRGGRGGYHSDFGGDFAGFDAGGVNFEDILSGIFGDQGPRMHGGARRQAAAKGTDVNYRLNVSFIEAAKGTKRRVQLPDGRSLDVTIPEGTRDGQTLRLKGQGNPGVGGGPSGDALVEVSVSPHPLFTLKGNDIRIDVPVTLKEAVFGAKIEVPTIDGPVTLPVPKHANSGMTLRLKDKGLKDRSTGQRGHQYVTLKVMLPDDGDPALEEFLKTWNPVTQHDPRASLKKMV